MTDRLARGSLAGKLEPRADALPGLRGSLSIERDVTLKAGDHVTLAAWLRFEPITGTTFLSIVAEPSGGRKR